MPGARSRSRSREVGHWRVQLACEEWIGVFRWQAFFALAMRGGLWFGQRPAIRSGSPSVRLLFTCPLVGYSPDMWHSQQQQAGTGGRGVAAGAPRV